MQRERKIAAVVLAAGMSRRMGEPKALLPLGDQPLIQHVVQSVRAVREISSIVVVTGNRADEVAAAVECSIARFVHNDAHETAAMLSSIQIGLTAVGEGVGAAVVALGDQPLIASATIAALINTWRESDALAVRPRYQSKRGHPVVLDRRAIRDVLALGADETLKDYLAQHERDVIELDVDDPMITFDVDTPADYEQVKQQYELMAGTGAK
ncbi:MAG TPA: nucleotidyltransferase family protein [Tepidisphaeraceae bacterium]|jgi:molybdenum cofactor cytidylyltransferase